VKVLFDTAATIRFTLAAQVNRHSYYRTKEADPVRALLIFGSDQVLGLVANKVAGVAYGVRVPSGVLIERADRGEPFLMMWVGEPEQDKSVTHLYTLTELLEHAPQRALAAESAGEQNDE
jgi:hypothetical protein